MVKDIIFKNNYEMKHNILTVSYFLSIYFLLPDQCQFCVCGSSHFFSKVSKNGGERGC